MSALVRTAASCVAIVLLLPALARAQAPQPLAPAHGYRHVAGSAPPTFTFAPGAGKTDYLWVHVSRSPHTDSTGLIDSDVSLGSFGEAAPSWTPPAETSPSHWLMTPGTYYWQPHRISVGDDADGFQEGAIRRFDVVASPSAPPPTRPPGGGSYAGLSRELIPRFVGRRARGFAYSVSTRGTPPDVGAARWKAIAHRAGYRWGMRRVGRAHGTPRSGDGKVEVGWGWLRSGALGVQTDLYRHVYRRHPTRRWICNKLPGRRRKCGWGRRELIRSELVDADLVVDRGVRWEPGPAYPSDAEYDLESVVLHEMGHLAGNFKHARPCRVTPMVERLDTGEWWRSTGDWHFRHCGSTAHATAASRRRGVKHVIRVETIEIGTGRSADAQLAALDRLPHLR